MARILLDAEKERLRRYSSAFSRRVFERIIEHGDLTFLANLHAEYDANRRKEKTYSAYLRYLYRILESNYRCEYIYKTKIIRWIIQEYSSENSVIFNEFRTPNAIADLVLFNGSSRAFEIKTEYDSPYRLSDQLQVYTQLFQETYLVISEQHIKQYISELPDNVGIIKLINTENNYSLSIHRKALKTEKINKELLMKVLHRQEYIDIIEGYFGYLPDTSPSMLYDACLRLLKKIPDRELQKLFIKQVKNRKNNTQILKQLPNELIQIVLQLRLNWKQVQRLLETIQTPIIHT